MTNILYTISERKNGQEPSWNFCKYLVKPDGTIKFYPSKVKPLDKEILDEIGV